MFKYIASVEVNKKIKTEDMLAYFQKLCQLYLLKTVIIIRQFFVSYFNAIAVTNVVLLESISYETFSF